MERALAARAAAETLMITGNQQQENIPVPSAPPLPTQQGEWSAIATAQAEAAANEYQEVLPSGRTTPGSARTTESAQGEMEENHATNHNP